MLDLKIWEEKIMNELQTVHFTDGSHDLDHFKRVVHRAMRLNEVEQMGGNPLTILAAGLLHDMVEVPKNSRDRSKASRMSADAAVELLQSMSFPSKLLLDVHHAIVAHSFTAAITPTTVEAKCIQDADRVEALGAMGIVRCLYTSGRMDTQIIHWGDPLARNRPLDDRKWAVDHFEVKLFHIPGLMQTVQGKALGEPLCDFIKEYREKLIEGGMESPEYHFAMMCVKEGRDSLFISDRAESIIENIVQGKCIVHPQMRYFIPQLNSELEIGHLDL